MRTIAHVYSTYAEATRVVEALESAGIPHSDISIVSGDKSVSTGTTTGTSTGTTTGLTSGDPEQGASTGAGTGATLGTVLGGGAGLLAGLGSLAIPGIGPIVAAGWLIATLTGAGVGAAAGGLLGSLTGAGLSEADAHTYSEGVSQGGTLVTVRVDDAQVSHVQQIINGGTTGYAASSTAGTAPATMAAATGAAAAYGSDNAYAGSVGTAPVGGTAPLASGTDTIKVVREDLTVGKREVEQGGVRVTSHVVETPVEEQVRLHEERVHVERRPVDQPLGSVPADAFQNKTIEARAMSEQAVVSKEARVVEEIGLRKEATDRVETVRDTVRETKVDIEDAATGTTPGTTTPRYPGV